MNSMTGYGRGLWEDARGGTLTVELRTVNNRFLNVRCRLPDALLRHEPRIESALKSGLARGSVTCQVNLRGGAGDLPFDEEALAGAWQKLEGFRRNHDVPGEVSMTTLVSVPQLFQTATAEADGELLAGGLDSALKVAIDELTTMRAREGSALAERLQSDLDELARGVEAVAAVAPTLAPKQKERFLERVRQLADDTTIDEAVLAREMAVLADRADISEEIDRLRSHLDQFGSALGAEGPVGRKLDFLLQEIHREINTIGSKSTDATLSTDVVGLKTVTERIREQVQNVE